MDDFRISDMFLDFEDSDFEAHVETLNETKLVIPVHGFLLRRTSNVFRTMLKENSFKEGSAKILNIKIPGYEDDAITFFRYIYTGKLSKLDIQSYIAILQVAHLYEVKGLFELCEQRIICVLSPYSVCRVYNLLEKIASESFLLHCKEVMLKFAFLIFAENLHTGLNEETLKYLLESDQLNVQNEEQAIQALWVWAHANSISVKNVSKESLDDKLKQFLQLVRSPSLKNMPKGFPWTYFVEQNRDLLGQNSERKCSDKISLKDYSSRLVVSQYAFLDQTPTKDSVLKILDIGVSHDVYLTGIILKAKYEQGRNSHYLSPFTVQINGSSTSGGFSFQNEILKSETINNKLCITSRLLLEFSKPILLVRSVTHKITAYNNNSFEFITYGVESDIQSERLCSGEKVNFMVNGKVTGVHEIFYILK